LPRSPGGSSHGAFVGFALQISPTVCFYLPWTGVAGAFALPFTFACGTAARAQHHAAFKPRLCAVAVLRCLLPRWTLVTLQITFVNRTHRCRCSRAASCLPNRRLPFARVRSPAMRTSRIRSITAAHVHAHFRCLWTPFDVPRSRRPRKRHHTPFCRCILGGWFHAYRQTLALPSTAIHLLAARLCVQRQTPCTARDAGWAVPFVRGTCVYF